jgi:hypothetical protein
MSLLRAANRNIKNLAPALQARGGRDYGTVISSGAISVKSFLIFSAIVTI